MGMEVDDDAYFADLSKQIALLIMDDDEQFSDQGLPRSVPVQYTPQTVNPPPPFAYNVAWRRESKGTGVFIPQSLYPRRRNRSRRSAPSNTSSYSHTDRSEVATSSNTGHNQLYNNYYYNNSGVAQRNP